MDTGIRGHDSAGGLEADHSVTGWQVKRRKKVLIKKRIRNQVGGHCPKERTHFQQGKKTTTKKHLPYEDPINVVQELPIFTQGNSNMRASA